MLCQFYRQISRISMCDIHESSQTRDHSLPSKHLQEQDLLDDRGKKFPTRGRSTNTGKAKVRPSALHACNRTTLKPYPIDRLKQQGRQERNRKVWRQTTIDLFLTPRVLRSGMCDVLYFPLAGQITDHRRGGLTGHQ